MRGFQLWINLPAREKMKPAGYRDIPAAQIPVVALDGGGSVKVIAGEVNGVAGPVAGITTEPVYLDVVLPPDASFRHALPAAHNAFVYAYGGSLKIGDRDVRRHAAGVLSAGDIFEAKAGSDGARFILLAGKPLREPVVQYGPFVMNTREEIEQTLADYRDGKLAA